MPWMTCSKTIKHKICPTSGWFFQNSYRTRRMCSFPSSQSVRAFRTSWNLREKRHVPIVVYQKKTPEHFTSFDTFSMICAFSNYRRLLWAEGEGTQSQPLAGLCGVWQEILTWPGHWRNDWRTLQPNGAASAGTLQSLEGWSHRPHLDREEQCS